MIKRIFLFTIMSLVLVGCAPTKPPSSMQDLNQQLAAAGIQKIRYGDNLIFLVPADTIFYQQSPRIENYQPLNLVALYLRQIQKVHVEVDGFTDNVGPPWRNHALSLQRARNVADFLWGRRIDARVITAEGFGQEFPIADNTNVAGQSDNRRIEIRTIYLGRRTHA